MDYRVLSLLTLLFWGLWGFLSKILTRNTPIGTFVLWGTIAGLLPIFLFAWLTKTLTWTHTAPLYILNGFLGSIGTIFFYFALQRGPASVVLPFTGMYIIIPVVLGYLILKEPLTIRHILGLIFGLLAVLFLSK